MTLKPGEVGQPRPPRAIVYCDREFGNANGKTAHGLVRYTSKFEVIAVVDSTLHPGDTGSILDRAKSGIPLVQDLDKCIADMKPEVFIIGAVSEGGGLPAGYDKAVIKALENGLDVISGLHYFLSDQEEFSTLAKRNDCRILDVRKHFRDRKRFYTGEISRVNSTRIAMIGTDSAIGKRTTAVLLNEELIRRGRSSDMIYTGQTGWLQGWPHGVVMDALINDFVSGGIEGAVLDSWDKDAPEFQIIEGQGSLVHPFFPGGFEIMTAAQIHGFILQDAPGRPNLDGFPDYPMPDPQRVVDIAKLLSEKELVGIAINSEGLSNHRLIRAITDLEERFNVPVEEPIGDGVQKLADAVISLRDD